MYTCRLLNIINTRGKDEMKERMGTHPLCGVILHLQLDAGAFPCDQYAPKDTGLHPNLSTLTDDKAFRYGPRVGIKTAVFLDGIIV
jgi:hypothetical protein